MNNKNIIYILTMLISASSFFVSDIYLSVMPIIGDSIKADKNQMQSMISVFLITSCLVSFVFGGLSDKYGRRPVLISSLVVSFVGSIILAFSSSYLQFLLGVILQGIGSVGGMMLARSILKDIFPEKNELRKKIAVFSLVVAVAPAISPTLGSWLTSLYGWHSMFVVQIILYGILYTLSLVLFKETAKSLHTQSMGKYLLESYFELFCNYRFMTLNILSAIVFGGYISFLAIAPYVLYTQLGLSGAQVSCVIFLLVIGSIGSRVLNTILSNYMDMSRIIIIGIGMITIASILYWLAFEFSLNLLLISSGAIVYVFGFGLLATNLTTLALLEAKNLTGVASSLYGTLQVAGGAVISFLIAMYSQQYQYYAFCILISLIVCISIFLYKTWSISHLKITVF